MIPSTTKDKDGKETTNGYYVLYFIGSRDNTEVNVGTVRHLLVAFEKDSKGNVTDAAKEAAKKEAEKLLKDFQDAGKLTEDDFAALIKKNSDDSPDGLYSDITPDSGYVKEFADWATAEHKAGDMEIVETEFGYHIMYYVSANDLNYRDFMIDNKLRSDAYKAWEEALLKAVTAEKLNTKYLETDLVIGG
jgi:parvulin-like peptidyl-prolyl isomerase